MHQPLLSLASYSHVNASRAFTMAAINVQSFFPYRPSLKKLSTGSHGNEFKFYFSREKSTLPFSYVSSLPTREHVRDVYFLNVFSYIYIQYRLNCIDLYNIAKASCSFHIFFNFKWVFLKFCFIIFNKEMIIFCNYSFFPIINTLLNV